MAQPQRKPHWEPPSRTDNPYRLRFPANDPIYRKVRELFKLYPWLKLFYRVSDLYNMLKQLQSQPVGFTHAGFKQTGQCPQNQPVNLVLQTGISAAFRNYTNNCVRSGLGGAVPYDAATFQVNPATTGLLFGKLDGTRMIYQQYWERPAPAVIPMRFKNPWALTEIDLLPLPEMNPSLNPKPVRFPYKALPYIKSPFRERSNHVEPKQNQKPNNQPRNIGSVESVITSTPSGRLNVAVKPSRHLPQKPREGIKENKQRSDSATAALAVASAVTETNDFVKSLWEALPYQYREHGYSGLMQDKLKDLYNHASHIDVAKALKNLAQNQIEDYAYGYLPSKYLSEINQKVFAGDKYRSRGIMTGHSQRQSYLR